LPFSDICLLHEGVSRRHALITSKVGADGDPEFSITDQGSSGGTFLNGVKLRQGEPLPLVEGDLLRIGPWTFRMTIGSASRETLSHTIDDAASLNQKLSRVGGASVSVAGRRLRLLARCISRLGSAREEDALAPIALELVMEGAPFGRGALIRAGEPNDDIQIVASRRANPQDQSTFSFSRSLIAAASGTGGGTVGPAQRGTVLPTGATQGTGPGTFVMTEASQPVSSHSIIQMTIHSAICAPVMIGESLWGLLYLDARAGEQGVSHDAAEFCEAVATALGLSLANLKRASLERRQQELTAELHAAREVQETIIPSGAGKVSNLSFAVRVLPGVFVAGDLFDAIELPGGRAAFFLGDVAGHGAGSGMLMAMVQSHLAALLLATGDLLGSIRAANTYLSAHISGGKFASLWAGLLEPSGLLRYVDAGHGHWFIRKANGEILSGRGRGGVPLGISSDSPYDEGILTLERNDRVVLFSDGVIEQRNPAGEYFSIERLHSVVQGSPTAELDVRRAFDELISFAGRTTLDDDATVASCQYDPS
jgi:serine phosphatase RsbU (regulator of sigma subunit)/pSer/pThr/pTyr-binding forkhead associated (FHA) protein